MLLAGIHRAGAPVAFLAYHIAFLCRTLNKTIALRGCKPGFGPAAEILSLRRQRKNSKKGDPGVAAPKGVPICAVQKMGRSETRSAQTAALLDPFSVPHKWRLHMGTANVKSNTNSAFLVGWAGPR